MEQKRLKELIRGGESTKVEFKKSLSLSESIGKTISSFSNASGGTLVIGVTDSGKIKGVDLGKDTLEKLANRIKHHTDPKTYPSISRVKVDSKDIVVIQIFQQIDKCNEYLSEHIAVMSRLHPGEIRREDIPEYGRFSIRELLTNAVCHRNYSDQGSKVIIKMFSNSIEFYNLGGLSQGITADNITFKQYSRNPIIAKVLAKVEYIEELGEGWDKIIREHEEHPLSLELPIIKSNEHSTTVTIFFHERQILKAFSWKYLTNMNHI